jgi:hypothetical protein
LNGHWPARLLNGRIANLAIVEAVQGGAAGQLDGR